MSIDHSGLLIAVEELYSLKDLTLQYVEEIGYTSSNLVLADNKNKYFLKKFNDNYSAEQIIRINHGIDFFHERGIPSVQSMTNRSGSKDFNYKKSFYSLFPFVEGDLYEYDELSEDHLRSMGELHGKMLLKGKDIMKIKHDFRVKDNNSRSILKEYLIEDKEIMDFFSENHMDHKKKVMEIQKIKREYFNNVVVDEVVELDDLGLVHGDFWHRNLIFDDNEIVAVLDFDKVKVDSGIKMVMRALDVICFNQKYDSKSYKRAKVYAAAIQEQMGFTMSMVEKGAEFWRFTTMLNNGITHNFTVMGNPKFEDMLDVNLERLKNWGSGYYEHKEKILDMFNEI